jgi:hypothetical protein
MPQTTMKLFILAAGQLLAEGHAEPRGKTAQIFIPRLSPTLVTSRKS